MAAFTGNKFSAARTKFVDCDKPSLLLGSGMFGNPVMGRLKQVDPGGSLASKVSHTDELRAPTLNKVTTAQQHKAC